MTEWTESEQVARDALMRKGLELPEYRGWGGRGFDVPFEALVGETIETFEAGTECVEITCRSGLRFRMHHMQDCCESVSLEETIGDVADLIGVPITMAEEVSGADGPAPEYADSYTWTFYKLATVKGYVTLRWLGESNGHYSETVDFECLGMAEADDA
jgi:hypothetical protein